MVKIWRNKWQFVHTPDESSTTEQKSYSDNKMSHRRDLWKCTLITKFLFLIFCSTCKNTLWFIFSENVERAVIFIRSYESMVPCVVPIQLCFFVLCHKEGNEILFIVVRMHKKLGYVSCIPLCIVSKFWGIPSQWLLDFEWNNSGILVQIELLLWEKGV